MKPSNASEDRPRPLNGSWLKALARRVRDWLDSLLEDGENRVTSLLPENSSIKSVTKQNDTGPAVNGTKQLQAPSWNGLQQPGAPEAWLQLVRERAPALLLSTEEGGVPWARPRGISAERDNQQQEMTSAIGSLPYYEEPAWPVKEPIKDAGSPTETAAVAKTFLRQMLRRLRPDAVSHKKQEPVARKRGSQLALEPPRLVTKVYPEMAAGSPLQHVQATQHAATESEPEALYKKSRTVAPPPSWRERVQRRLREVFPNAVMNRPLSKGPAGHKNDNAQLAAREMRSQHFAMSVNRVSSPSTAESVSFEWPSADDRPKPGVSKSQKGSHQSTLGMRPNPSKWAPLPTNTTLFGMQSHESSRGGAKKGGIQNVQLPASQRVDLHSFGSALWLESQPIDSWPELPVDSRAHDAGWRESLRISDHLRAIDLEQRGDR